MTTGAGGAKGGEPRLGLPDAAGTGLAATVGAGLFVAPAPAAAAAGDQLVVAVLVASLLAAANAWTAVRLAGMRRGPVGTHVHGRELLGLPWGHLSAWSFAVGKTAACAAVAVTIGVHVLPDWAPVIGIAAVGAVTALHLQDIERSARAARVIALLVILAVVVFVVVLLVTPPTLTDAPVADPGAGGLVGTVRGAGFAFFALTGFALLANLGDEVAEPRRTLPRAMAVSLTVVVLLLGLVVLALGRTLGVGWVAAREAPLAEAAEISAWPWLGPTLRVAAVLACGGVLAGLLPSVARTVAALARDRHLPPALAVREGRRLHPRRAESLVAVLVVVAVLMLDLWEAIALASFGVLVHFALAHAAAWQLDSRPLPRAVCAFGVVGCLGTAVLLPWPTVVTGTVLLLVGAVIGWVRHTTKE